MSEIIAVLPPLLCAARGEGEATRTARVGHGCVRVNNNYVGEGYLSVRVNKSSLRACNCCLRDSKLTVGYPCLNARMDKKAHGSHFKELTTTNYEPSTTNYELETQKTH